MTPPGLATYLDRNADIHASGLLISRGSRVMLGNRGSERGQMTRDYYDTIGDYIWIIPSSVVLLSVHTCSCDSSD